MRNAAKTTLLCLSLAILVPLMGACGQQDHPRANAVSRGRGLLAADTGNVKVIDGTTWIPVKQVAQALDLRIMETANAARLGFTDIMFEVYEGHKHAVSFGSPISLPEAPIRENGRLYMTTEAVSALLHTKANINPTSGALELGSIRLQDQAGPSYNDSKGFTAFGVAENREAMVSYAKQYLGVPYEFGAAPYEQSKTFDCSSFTRHVFKRFGQDLPRLARDQAKEGSEVSRSNLQVGDLIFFTVPGRFQADSIPGHVGIYIGGGNFIHTWGDPGVQISSLDSGYWSDVIISMRRIR